MPFENPGAPPVLGGDTSAQAHVDWLEELREALQSAQWFISILAGGTGDGVIAYGDDADDIGKVKATSTPGMSIVIRPTAASVAGVPFRVPAELVTTAFTAPVADPRIDAVVAQGRIGLSGAFVVYAGVEASSPVAPSIGANDTLLAWVHHRVGETSIKNTDDATNGWIEDKRTWKNI